MPWPPANVLCLPGVIQGEELHIIFVPVAVSGLQGVVPPSKMLFADRLPVAKPDPAHAMYPALSGTGRMHQVGPSRSDNAYGR